MQMVNRKVTGVLLLLLAGLIPVTGHPSNPGDQAPNFSVQHILDGSQISLDQYRGKVIYLDFWASWCPPCLKSFSFMDELQRQYGKQGFVVIAVSLDENNQDARDFLQENPVNFFVGQNAQGDIAESYDVKAMPSSYLIGRDGLIKQVHLGFKSNDKDKLNQLILSLL